MPIRRSLGHSLDEVSAELAKLRFQRPGALGVVELAVAMDLVRIDPGLPADELMQEEAGFLLGWATSPAPGASAGSPRRSGRGLSRWPGRCHPGSWLATRPGFKRREVSS